MRADTTKETTIGTCPVCKREVTATVRFVLQTVPDRNAVPEENSLTLNVTAKPIGLTMRHTCDTTKQTEGVG